ncbi:YrhK family protein [Salinisphaera sp. P385]|uniref:YrhK family protein n=1 Tax=Spectribacter acetivorans TaxID=3075603 RepID=A0ABU3BAC8_9GAMM|nr:YrhK family protein [Salinisphaera sp. P385]MDT0619403.1 YrhK family protein [Salinisphaera sp. P385]
MSNTAPHSRFDTLASDVEYRVHQRFEWSHIVVLGLGNLLFLVGSWLFFYPPREDLAIWLFVIGSGFHLFGSILRVLNKQYVHRFKKQAIHW